MTKLPALLLILAPIYSVAENNTKTDDIFTIVSASATSGECGMISQLYKFQSTRKTPEGKKVIDDFIETEMSRRGTTIVDFSNKCDKSLSAISSLVEESNNKNY